MFFLRFHLIPLVLLASFAVAQQRYSCAHNAKCILNGQPFAQYLCQYDGRPDRIIRKPQIMTSWRRGSVALADYNDGWISRFSPSHMGPQYNWKYPECNVAGVELWEYPSPLIGESGKGSVRVVFALNKEYRVEGFQHYDFVFCGVVNYPRKALRGNRYVPCVGNDPLELEDEE